MWLVVLVFGAVGWLFSAWVSVLTDDRTLVPSVILLGSFLIPVTCLAWIYVRDQRGPSTVGGHRSALLPQRLVGAFALSGVYALTLSALIEVRFLAHHPLSFYLGVAIVEELVKVAFILILARGLPFHQRRDGMMLGAAVGLGFSAFETAGYAFNRIVAFGQVDVGAVVETELVRGLLTPFGHALWTALIGGALFDAAARNSGRFRVSGPVLGWFTVAVVLHALWDSTAAISVYLAYRLTGQELVVADLEGGHLSDPTSTQAHIFAISDFTVLFACSVVGCLIAAQRWRSAPATDAPVQGVPPPVAT